MDRYRFLSGCDKVHGSIPLALPSLPFTETAAAIGEWAAESRSPLAHSKVLPHFKWALWQAPHQKARAVNEERGAGTAQ